jgi:hypothetical protein
MPYAPNVSPSREPQRSLRYEYELYVEREIEEYKDSVPRNVLLSIGDDAVAALSSAPQFTLTEIVLCEEVDRIIRARLRIPSYATWQRRRLRLLARFRRPEHWGMRPECPLVREIHPATDSRVLVAGTNAEGPVLYLAANGCEVTAVEAAADAVERVMLAAGEAGLTERVHGCVSDLGHWSPEVPLNAVVCTPAAFEGLSAAERAHVIEVLQGATADGGVHLVQTIVAGQTALTLDELRRRYRGWAVSVEFDVGASKTFLARKAIA